MKRRRATANRACGIEPSLRAVNGARRGSLRQREAALNRQAGEPEPNAEPAPEVGVERLGLTLAWISTDR